jgi:hypothetical protein
VERYNIVGTRVCGLALKLVFGHHNIASPVQKVRCREVHTTVLVVAPYFACPVQLILVELHSLYMTAVYVHVLVAHD